MDIEHRTRGRFGNGFLTTFGVLTAITAFLIGMPLLFCGGCFAGLFGLAKTKEVAKQVREEYAEKQRNEANIQQSVTKPTEKTTSLSAPTIRTEPRVEPQPTTPPTVSKPEPTLPTKTSTPEPVVKPVPSILPNQIKPPLQDGNAGPKVTHTITPRQVASKYLPIPSGKFSRLVEQYEDSTDTAAQSRMVSDETIFLIDAPTPTVTERIADGWAYTRPTEGPHKGRLIVIREIWLKPVAKK